MNLSRLFIERPIATALLAVAIVISGVAAFFRLPVAPLPRVDFPTISVSASLPGASPDTMASSVATPLERRFGRIAGVTEITSTSGVGSTQITLQFDLDRDVDAAARDVQAAINAAGGELPSNLPTRPNYRKVNPADTPILILALKSQTIPLAQVYDVANSVLAQKVAQLEGVGQVFVGGGQQPAVRVQVDPAALAGMGIGLEDVRAAIVAASANTAKGSIDGPNSISVIAVNDQLFGADAYRKIVIAAKDGAAVRLGDVAKVIDSVENSRAAAWVDGERAVLLVIRRQPGANIIETIERVKALIPALKSNLSPAISIEVASDRAQTIRASVHEVESALGISVALVVAVVFVFLRSPRATLIPTVAVPLSLVGTFGVMYLLDYSLDNLSLMALTISTGFVVDDAIVVTENIARHIELGEKPREAAIKGAKQIGFTIVSITVSLLAVFIPILLMGGIVGRLFREFAVTLSVAIAVSMVVSLTLTPMMCSKLLLPKDALKHGKAYAFSERVFNGMVALYGRALAWVLRHTRLMTAVTFGAIALNVYLFIAVPKGLFPQQDGGLLTGFSEAAQDTSFPSMKGRQEQINAIVQQDPEVAHVVAFLGGGFNTAVNTGTMFVELKPLPPRQASADQIIGRLRPKLGQATGVNLFLQAAQDVRIGGRIARTQYQYVLQDADIDEMRTWAPKILDKLRTLPELKDVATDLQSAGLQLFVSIDRDTAARLDVPAQAIDDALYDAFGQRQIATNFTQLNQYRVVLEAKPKLAETPDALEGIYVKSRGGVQIPLSTFAKYKVASTPLSITHQGQFPAVTLSFNTAPNVSLGQAVDAIHRAEQEIRMPASIHATFSGTAQAFASSLSSQPMLILAALLTVYMVLGVLYESLIHPITILSTLPSAGIGAVAALMIFKTDFSIIALIGVILLIGIVKKNAIMMIDFAIEAERDHGKSPRDAIYEACLLRFRPILMTTLAALLGGLPLALGTGTGAELRRPLGIAIVGGLLFSQVLTLFTTPVVYLGMDRFTKRRRLERRRSHEPPPPKEERAPELSAPPAE
ncbi:MAG: multidrug efflux RND transporter permease subunit [Polyangiaceae bacterium]